MSNHVHGKMQPAEALISVRGLLIAIGLLVLLLQPLGAAAQALQPPPSPRAPAPPVHVQATVDNGALVLSWSAPYNNDSPITTYTLNAYSPNAGGPAVATRTVIGTQTKVRWIGIDTPLLRQHVVYTFTVLATNAFGDGPASKPSNSVVWDPGVTAPAQPADVRATSGSRDATVTWDAPDGGGSSILGYEISVYGGNAQDPIIRTSVDGDTTQVLIGDLNNAQSYSFTVQAVNASGWSPLSDRSNTIFLGRTPGAPSNVQAVASNASATVNWFPPNDGGSAIDKYLVRAYLGNTTTVVTSREVPGNATSVILMGIDRPLFMNGTAYTFTVQAENVNGWGPESNRSSPITPGPQVPGAPTGVHAGANGSTVSLSWSAPYNGGSAITSYVVRTYLSTSSQPVSDTFVQGSTTSTTITNLAAGNQYSFSVFAINAAGWSGESGRSNLVTPATLPDAPTSVRAETGIGSAVVRWLPGASNGGSQISGYTVIAFEGTSSSPVTTVTVGRDATSAAIVGLPNGGTYTFAVQAANAVGLSPLSVRSVAITLPTVPAAPRNVIATADDSSVHLQWDTPASDGGMPVESYTITASDGIHTPTVVTTAATSTTIPGLINGLQYTLSVVAVNKVGQGSAASTNITPRNLPPTLQVPGNQTVRYGDAFALDVSASGPETHDHITLSASGLPTGLSFVDHGNGTGSVAGTAQAPAGTYAVTFTANDGHNGAVSQPVTITITARPAAVTLSSGNPTAIKLKKANGRAKLVSLRATIGGMGGDISNVGAVTYTLTEQSTGVTRSCTATRTGVGADGTLGTACDFNSLPSGAYLVEIKTGNAFYLAAAETRLIVYYPAHGSVRASGSIDRGTGHSPINLRATVNGKGRLTGQLTYTEHRTGADVQLRSTSLEGMLVKGGVAYIQGVATLNGHGSYRFVATVDRRDGGHVSLWVTDTSNATVSDLTFDHVQLSGGAIQIRT